MGIAKRKFGICMRSHTTCCSKHLGHSCSKAEQDCYIVYGCITQGEQTHTEARNRSGHQSIIYPHLLHLEVLKETNTPVIHLNKAVYVWKA